MLLLLGGCLIACGQEPSAESDEQPFEYRTWTDASGRYEIEAALVNFGGGQVGLKKRDGSVVAVPLDRLSRTDQNYVRSLLSRRTTTRSTRRPPTPESPMEGPAEAVPQPSEGEWPGWRGPARDGKSLDADLLKQWPGGGPRLLWKSDLLGKGYSNVSVSGGTVYATGDVDGKLTVFAFDGEGGVKWRVPHDNAWTKNYPGSRSTPTIDGGRLYVVSGHGLLGCYDAGSGRRIWTRHFGQFGGEPPNWGYAESPLVYGNLVIVTPGGQNCIVALDKTSGQPAWASQGFAAGAQYGSCYPIQYQGARMIVAGTAAGIVGVDAQSGRMLWANPFSADNTANCPTPVFSDGYVFWANGYGKGGICLKLNVSAGRVSAQEAWTTRDMVCHHGGYVILDGYIYGNHNAGWVCLELATGRKVWEERGVGKGSLCYADGMLYLFGERGGQAALATCSPQGMEMKGSFSVEGDGTSWAHPVVAGGRLYLRYEKNLYCFDVKGG